MAPNDKPAQAPEAGSVSAPAPKVSRRQLALGVVLGMAAGIFILSVLTMLIGATIVYLVVFTLGIALIAPFFVGIVLGTVWARARPAPELSWLALLLVAVLFWSAAAVLPFAGRAVQLRIVALSTIPAYPRSRDAEVDVRFGDGENSGDRVHIRYVTADDSPAVVAFYRQELKSAGWVEGPPHFIEWKMDDTPHWFKKEDTFASLHIKFGQRMGAEDLPVEVILDP